MVQKWWFFFFWETQYKRKRSYTRAYTHPYERTHAHPTPMSTSERLSRQIRSWDWRSHHGRLAIDGNVASHWKNIPPLWDTQMSNLGFELWWAGGTTTLLTTQPIIHTFLTKWIAALHVHKIIIYSYFLQSILLVINLDVSRHIF
jgi:hypothetical protein